MNQTAAVSKSANLIRIPLSEQDLRLRVLEDIEDPPERVLYWWAPTTSAIALARHVEKMNVLGKRVIELGCGPGLPGITANLQGARVTLTDYTEAALSLARENAALNDADPTRLEFRRLDWENPEDLGSFDIIIGAEIMYDYFFHSALLATLRRLSHRDSSIILVDRKRLAIGRFIGRCRRSGFDNSEYTENIDEQGFPQQDVTVFTLSRR
jgi:predicted nicotinamide N-methyase